jgi:hypothetical protein
MRALWSLVVVCLVAATGVRPAEARRELHPTAIDRAQPAAHAIATRPSPQVIGARRAHGPELRLPPVVLAMPFELRARPARALARANAPCDRIFATLVLTRSARGPPIA